MSKRKLSKSDYMIIFNLHADGYRNKDIAEMYDINPSRISKVLHWKFGIKTDRCGEKNANSKLTKDDVEKIVSYRKKGYSYATIAAIFDVQIGACSKIVHRRAWPKHSRKAA